MVGWINPSGWMGAVSDWVGFWIGFCFVPERLGRPAGLEGRRVGLRLYQQYPSMSWRTRWQEEEAVVQAKDEQQEDGSGCA